MKIFGLFLVVTLGLVQSRSLQQSSDSNIITVTVLTGSLNQEVDALVNAWALDSKSVLQLPITQSELVNVNYIEYTAAAHNKHTKSPNFGVTVGVPSGYFTDQSYLALEVYNNATSPATYIGGRIATIAMVKQVPHSYQVQLLDQAGNNAGELYFSWI